MTQFQEKGRYENVSAPFLMNTENLKPDPSTALTSYPLLRMTFLSEIIQRMILIWWKKALP